MSMTNPPTTKRILSILANNASPGPITIAFDSSLYSARALAQNASSQSRDDFASAEGQHDIEGGIEVVVPDDPASARKLVGELLNEVLIESCQAHAK